MHFSEIKLHWAPLRLSIYSTSLDHSFQSTGNLNLIYQTSLPSHQYSYIWCQDANLYSCCRISRTILETSWILQPSCKLWAVFDIWAYLSGNENHGIKMFVEKIDREMRTEWFFNFCHLHHSWAPILPCHWIAFTDLRNIRCFISTCLTRRSKTTMRTCYGWKGLFLISWRKKSVSLYAYIHYRVWSRAKRSIKRVLAFYSCFMMYLLNADPNFQSFSLVLVPKFFTDLSPKVSTKKHNNLLIVLQLSVLLHHDSSC